MNGTIMRNTYNISSSVSADMRPAFTHLFDRMEKGDMLIATKFCRLRRSTMNIRKAVEQLATHRSAGIKSHSDAV